MKIETAEKHRQAIIALLSEEKLPVTDLPDSLHNFAITSEDSGVTGVIGLEVYGNYGLLRSLAVNRNFRNRGIANALLLHIEKFAVTINLKAILLLTETASGYFCKKGYSVVTRATIPAEVRQSSEFSHGCPQSATVMQKSISLNQ
jgi:amino-acid N-acetyltransferase